MAENLQVDRAAYIDLYRKLDEHHEWHLVYPQRAPMGGILVSVGGDSITLSTYNIDEFIDWLSGARDALKAERARRSSYIGDQNEPSKQEA